MAEDQVLVGLNKGIKDLLSFNFNLACFSASSPHLVKDCRGSLVENQS